MSRLVNAEVNSGNHIKAVLASNYATRIRGRHRLLRSRPFEAAYGIAYVPVPEAFEISRYGITEFASISRPSDWGLKIHLRTLIIYSGEILFHVEKRIWNQVKINSDELRRYVSQDIWSKSTENTFDVLCRFTLLCLLKWYNFAVIESFLKCRVVYLSLFIREWLCIAMLKELQSKFTSFQYKPSAALYRATSLPKSFQILAHGNHKHQYLPLI